MSTIESTVRVSASLTTAPVLLPQLYVSTITDMKRNTCFIASYFQLLHVRADGLLSRTRNEVAVITPFTVVIRLFQPCPRTNDGMVDLTAVECDVLITCEQGGISPVGKETAS